MMRVGLMNLGDGPRVFHNKINRPVVVPVGRVVVTDLDTRAIQDLKFPARPETVLVCSPDTQIPEEMEKIIALLTIIEFEQPNIVLQKFQEIAPPNNLGPTMRPSRMQMREVLRTMVEDYIHAQVRVEASDAPLIKDDVDPSILQRELDRQLREDNEPEPVHPLRQERDEAVIAATAPAMRAPVRARETTTTGRRSKRGKVAKRS